MKKKRSYVFLWFRVFKVLSGRKVHIPGGCTLLKDLHTTCIFCAFLCSFTFVFAFFCGAFFVGPLLRSPRPGTRYESPPCPFGSAPSAAREPPLRRCGPPSPTRSSFSRTTAVASHPIASPSLGPRQTCGARLSCHFLKHILSNKVFHRLV